METNLLSKGNKMNFELEEKIELISGWLQEKKASSVVCVDVRGKCSFTEYLVISTGTASIHNKALADYIFDKAREYKFQVFGKEGLDACSWILIDMNDVIVHIFNEETLNMYKLEDLWKNKNTIQEQ